jgi:hypothetical protein
VLSSTHIVVSSSLHIHKLVSEPNVNELIHSSGRIHLPRPGSVNVLFYPSTLSLHRGALQFPVPVSL